jgi:hypothetical protein
MTRWLVTTTPVASTRNPDARDSAVQIATTLSCHFGAGAADVLRSTVSSRGRRGADLRVGGGQLEHDVASGLDVDRLRPLIALAVEGDRLVRLHGVVARRKPDLRGAVRAGDDPPGCAAGRVVADEQGMARNRRRRPGRVGQRDLDVEDAEPLTRRDAGAHGDERDQGQRANHQHQRLSPERSMSMRPAPGPPF